MDEKKVRKAIQMLRIEKKECKKLLDFHGNKQWNSGILRRKIEDCNTAIEALKKQLRLKPIRVCDKESVDYQCPVCGTVLMSMYPDYEYGEKTDCCKCRQAIDWSE